MLVIVGETDVERLVAGGCVVVVVVVVVVVEVVVGVAVVGVVDEGATEDRTKFCAIDTTVGDAVVGAAAAALVGSGLSRLKS